MAHRDGAGSGFTLLEMIAALALMAVLATALYVSLHTGFRARARAEASISPLRSATLALEFLRRDIQSALPPTGVLAGTFFGLDETGSDGFSSDADTLEFFVATEDMTGRGARISKVEFAVVSSEDGGERLLVRRVTENLLAPETPDPAEEVLCRDVTSLNFRYFDGSEWWDNWDSSVRDNALPLAAEVALAVRCMEIPRGGEKEQAVVRIFQLPCGVMPTGRGTDMAQASLL